MNEFELRLTNTINVQKEIFIPVDSREIKMYVCGITPYDDAHIGHGRVYVTFDILYRLLKFLGYNVKYCRNFTDIDDKILKKAQEKLSDIKQYKEISEQYIKSYHEDMKKLNCLSPNCEPRVTEFILQIINFIKQLVDKNKAYVVDGDVYYSVKDFHEYGKLSKQNLDELKIGARVEIDVRKRNPLDFALWKSEKGEVDWPSPWGNGRPGWAIECSVMAKECLGEHIDIHGGGMDLIFPHHENEIAQSEGLFGAPFAKYWIHNAFVRINKEKMSKSLSNFFTLKQVFEKFDPMVLRFYYINHNYNIPLDFSFDDLERAQKTYNKICKIFEHVSVFEITEKQVKKSVFANTLLNFLLDDLNCAGLLGAFFEHIKEFENNNIELGCVKFLFQNILGLTLEPLLFQEIKITPEIQKLIDERNRARSEKNWAKSDELRERLKQLGFEIHDKTLK